MPAISGLQERRCGKRGGGGGGGGGGGKEWREKEGV
jgi:hypothetical protein